MTLVTILYNTRESLLLKLLEITPARFIFSLLKKKNSKSKDNLLFALHREFRGYLNFQIGINVNQNF